MSEEIIIHKEVIYRDKFEGNIDIIDKHIKHILEFDKGRFKTNVGGYQSNFITFGFEELIKKGSDMCTSIGLKNNNMEGMWININDGNSFNHPHIHSFVSWSMVYYHNICCDKCPIVFTHLVPQLVDKFKYKYVPKEGDIILFSGRQPHSVMACGNPDHRRISVAMNFRTWS